MTISPPAGRGDASASPRPDAPRPDVPALADGIQLIGAQPGSGYKDPPALVRRADGQMIQLTPLLFQVLEAVDGHRTYGEIAEQVTTTYGKSVSAANIATLVDDKLRPIGVLLKADGSEPALKKSNPLLGLRMRYAVTDPVKTDRITTPFAALFHPVLVVAVVAAFVYVSWWLLFDKGLASATHEAFGSSGSNWRSNTFSATGSAWFESVVWRNFRFVFAAIPASRMTFATKFTPHACPRSTNSAWMRGLP